MSASIDPLPAAGDIRILIVDDSAVFREALSGFLHDIKGMVVVGSAGSGQEGVTLVSRLKPQVVLLDLCMIGLDGFETTRLMKRLSNAPAVVVVTTSDDDRFRRAALAVGADAFVAKRRVGSEIEAVIHSVARARAGQAAEGGQR